LQTLDVFSGLLAGMLTRAEHSRPRMRPEAQRSRPRPRPRPQPSRPRPRPKFLRPVSRPPSSSSCYVTLVVYNGAGQIRQNTDNPRHSVSRHQLSGTLCLQLLKVPLPSPLSSHIWKLNCSLLHTTRS